MLPDPLESKGAAGSFDFVSQTTDFFQELPVAGVGFGSLHGPGDLAELFREDLGVFGHHVEKHGLEIFEFLLLGFGALILVEYTFDPGTENKRYKRLAGNHGEIELAQARFHLVELVFVAGYKDDGYVLAERSCFLEPYFGADSGKRRAHQHQLRGFGFDKVQTCFSGFGLGHLVTAAFEYRDYQLAKLGVGVDYEDFFRHEIRL